VVWGTDKRHGPATVNKYSKVVRLTCNKACFLLAQLSGGPGALISNMLSCNPAHSNTICCYEQLVPDDVDQTPAGPYVNEKKMAATENVVGASRGSVSWAPVKDIQAAAVRHWRWLAAAAKRN